jgi:hypothetical protein
MLVISYVPLLTNEPFRVEADSDEIIETIGSSMDLASNFASAKGCAWVKNDGVPSPILILDKGDDVVEHLISWSEGKPEEWFNLVAVEMVDGGYNVVLMPRVGKSIERHIKQFGGSSDDCKVLFMPINFGGKITDSSRSCLEALPSRCKVGFLDEAFTLFASVDSLDSKVRWLEFDLLSVYDNMSNVSLVQYFGEGKVAKDYGYMKLPLPDAGDLVEDIEE